MSPVRFHLVTPAQPKYRVPVFRELASRENVELLVFYGKNSIVQNVLSEGYAARETPERRLQFRGRTALMWHSAQLVCAASFLPADVLGLSWNVRYASLVPALLLARFRGIPTLLWGHGFSKQESWFRRYLRIRVGRLATAVVVYNHLTAAKVIDGGIDSNKVFVALNALDQASIQKARLEWLQDTGRLAAFRQAQGIEHRSIVLFVSRLDPENRVELLLEAIATVGTVVTGATAVIIGSGTAEADLRRRARELGLADKVRFLGPIYEESDLAAWMLCADVFCYPANIGLSLLHAFGYGLPVVTGDNISAHNPEIEAFEDGVNGLFFRHGDARSLADTLELLIKDKELAVRLGEEALRTVLERFTLEGMVNGLEAAIEYAAGCGNPSRKGH